MNKVASQPSPEIVNLSPAPRRIRRRAFLRGVGLGVAALAPAGVLFASNSKGKGKALGKGHDHGNQHEINGGDAALLRFAAAAEILETDFWVQYNELAGIQDVEEPDGSGNPDYTEAVKQLDEDMDQYIHDNTEDE